MVANGRARVVGSFSERALCASDGEVHVPLLTDGLVSVDDLLQDRSGLHMVDGLHRRDDVLDDRGVVVDERGSLRHYRIESVDRIGGVVDGAHGTVRLDEGVLAWGRGKMHHEG
uniref:Uncharacterized protein n=1 Tax=Anopheles atroparvus TaxID=41427 RepID=A0A182JLH3_ANOAO